MSLRPPHARPDSESDPAHAGTDAEDKGLGLRVQPASAANRGLDELPVDSLIRWECVGPPPRAEGP